ncbi:hypothetical protein PY793_04325 [Acetobacter fabarum]|uniref:hypothetical protein n=1 Tax=Acetobacter fabarum TaxID=483199 RepID=UPI00312B3598
MTSSVLPLLRDGGPLLAAFEGVRALLEPVFPTSLFRYEHVQPRMSAARWAEIARVAPTIGMSLADWNSNTLSGTDYRGDVSIPVFLVVRQDKPEFLLKGTKNPGVMGMMAAAIFALDSQRIEGVGQVSVKRASNLEAANWIDDRTAIATLNVVVKNVGYSKELARAQLADLSGVDGTWDFAPVTTAQSSGAEK